MKWELRLLIDNERTKNNIAAEMGKMMAVEGVLECHVTRVNGPVPLKRGTSKEPARVSIPSPDLYREEGITRFVTNTFKDQSFTKADVDLAAAKAQLNLGSVGSALTRLVNQKILIRKSPGEYLWNADYVALTQRGGGEKKTWTNENIEYLKEAAENELPVAEIAQVLGRTQTAVRQKAFALDLIPLGHRRSK
jgi:hypothetical protein